jgi:hypothetical protein
MNADCPDGEVTVPGERGSSPAGVCGGEGMVSGRGIAPAFEEHTEKGRLMRFW